jgi:cytochrome c biogenesis protein CcdA
MLQILIGSFALSVVHALIPNHWIPLIAISRTEKWSRRETLGITAVTASAHTLSTILIGIAIGMAGYKLSTSYEFVARIATPSILIILGIIYFILERRGSGHHHEHIKTVKTKRKSKFAITISLSAAMFFSPCLELEAYYLTAGTLGWRGIIAVSAVYFFITVSGIILLVFLGQKGIDRLNWHFLEHHEKGLTGAVLIAVGILAYFIDI